LGSLLSQPINSPAAIAAGIRSPWPTFSSLVLNTVGQALRPYPQYSDVYNLQGKIGIDRYNSLQTKVTHRLSNGLTFLASFSWSKNMTTVPATNGNATGQSTNNAPNNRAAEISDSELTPPVEIKGSMSYDLPFGKGRYLLHNSKGISNALLGGWQLVFFLDRASGAALSIVSSNNLGAYGFQAKRANVITGVPLVLKNTNSSFNPTTDYYINSAAFAAPATYSLGDTARTLDWLRGPAVASEQAALNKSFRIRERMSARISGEFTNPFNFVRFSNPVTTVTASNFGKITASAAGRRGQLKVDIQF
jgi:hypothetical protein